MSTTQIKSKMWQAFHTNGSIVVRAEWRKSSGTHNLAGLYHGEKFAYAGGGGYCKTTAIVEEALHAITGEYHSLGGYRNGTYSNKAGTLHIQLTMLYEGNNELSFSLTKQEQTI